MKLIETIAQYSLCRDVVPSTTQGYREAVASLSTWLGRPAGLADLKTETINAWLKTLQTRGLSSHTVAKRRRDLLVIARFAARSGLAGALSGELRRVKTHATPKRCWPDSAVNQLLAAIQTLEDRPNPKTLRPRRAFWDSVVRAAWDSALRQSDLLRLTFSEVGPVVHLVQRKTQIEHSVRFTASTLAAIDALPRGSDAEPVWPVSSRRWWQEEWRRITHAAGLVGPFTQLRRSSILDAETERAGSGMFKAGHTNATTTVTWYLPRTSMMELVPMPTELASKTGRNDPRRYIHGFKLGEPLVLQLGGETIDMVVSRDDRGRHQIVIENDRMKPAPTLKRKQG